jgi:hypothetical protein
VLHQPVFLTVAKVAFDIDQTDGMPLFVAFEPLPVTVAEFVTDAHYGLALPPPDLVITLGVLLI